MKRGRDDEKIMEPMFPRLHVNDKEKGGPRAPPRNKMALYEQLSIPSQRLNPGLSIPPSSSSQGSDLDRNMFYLPETVHNRQLRGASVNAPTVQPRKKVRDEDDFLVPVFVNSGAGQHHNKNKGSFDGERIQNVCDKDPNRCSSSGAGLRKEGRDQSEESSKVCSSRERSMSTSADLSTREKIDGCAKEDNMSRDQACGVIDGSQFSGSRENDACSLQKLRAGRQQVDNGGTDDTALMTGIGEGTLSRKRSMSYSEASDNVPDETNNESECRVDKTCGSLQLANGDKSDEASETSMVDSVSGSDISPDDVVGIIGQRRFWKARRAIVNQQRVFAVQVFELHRLIKVQKLIAGSPHILLEDTAYLSKPSFKDSPSKKLSPEFIVKSLPHAKSKEDSEKLSHKMECSAENAVGRTSLSSVKTGSQPSNYGPFLGNPPALPMNGDNNMIPWGFNQMLGQQWLVPVMSRSEGLIYKPCPAPGFMGPTCGGSGPFGQTPMTGNFTASAYGVSAPPHQGLGVLPGAPFPGHSYFAPYGMPFMNPAFSGSRMEQMNQFSGPGSYAQSGQLSGSGANFDMQPSEKNSAIPSVMKSQASKDTEQQRGTASSLGESSAKDHAGSNAEWINAPPLLSTAQSIPERNLQPQDKDQRTRVIRVVPHNRRSATESAARIFRSIQKEREQSD